MKKLLFQTNRLIFKGGAPEGPKSAPSDSARSKVETQKELPTITAQQIKIDSRVLQVFAREQAKTEKSADLKKLSDSIGSRVDFAKKYCDTNDIKYNMVDGQIQMFATDGALVDTAWQTHLHEISSQVDVIRKSLGVSPDALQKKIQSLRESGQLLG